ncbi:sphingosine hydroxylase [Rhizoctonia solani]|nr:sphingosine hydroxylase [Rhizoctonia solani]
MTMNVTSAFYDSLVPSPLTYPWYHSSKPDLLDWISDKHLSLAAPIIAYWILSLLFHAIDTFEPPFFERYRLHESEEVKSRNLVSRADVIWAVFLQHIIQTGLGLVFLDESGSESSYNHAAGMRYWAPYSRTYVGSYGQGLVHFTYWWFIPSAQFLFALLVMDTWQYFLHRLFHVNKYLYRKFHSVHHRLYVPYAYGALYNHWFEGLVLDTLGAAVSHFLSGMGIRQGIFLFAFSTLKTVDDHCGYALPFDPFQLFFGNNAPYHDIHHQSYGLKKNFSQPFFVHWDTILGTKMDPRTIKDRADARLKKKEKEL